METDCLRSMNVETSFHIFIGVQLEDRFAFESMISEVLIKFR